MAALAATLLAGGALAGKDNLVVDLVQEPSSLDPHVQWNPDSYFVYRNVFDNMVTRDDDGKIVPQVATAWKQVDDTTIEFTLRGDIKFHDGTPLTAEDVAFSVKRITDPGVQEPAARPVRQDRRRRRRQPDDRAAEDRRRPTRCCWRSWSSSRSCRRRMSRRSATRSFNQEPMGSGPYKFVLDPARREDRTWRATTPIGAPRAPFPTVDFHAVPGPGDAPRRICAPARPISIVTINADLAKELEDGREGEGAHRADRARRLFPPQLADRPDRDI